ncbi:MAG: hypothetical protein MK078_00550 [Crocinitomicaceae bacterium]|nr:hypothetical protein [Crocinitomicaceae bacterium]
MNKNLSLGISIGVFVIAIVGLLLGYFAMTDQIDDPISGGTVPDPASIDSALNFTYLAIILALAGWIIFSIWKIIQNPKGFIVTGIGIVLFAIILFIGYSVAGGADTSFLDRPAEITDGSVLNSNTGLIVTYITLIITVLTIVAGLALGLLRYFKK